MLKSVVSILLSILVFISCSQTGESTSEKTSSDTPPQEPVKKRPLAIEKGRIFEKGDKKYLWGGR